MADMTYEHEELVRAVDRLQQMGSFSTHVSASEKAGVILNDAIDSFEQAVSEGLADELKTKMKKEDLEGNLGSLG